MNGIIRIVAREYWTCGRQIRNNVVRRRRRERRWRSFMSTEQKRVGFC